MALRWALVGSSTPVSSFRDVSECWELLRASPESVLVLELRGAIPPGLGACLLEFRDRFPLAMLIVVGRPEDARALWLARELGAAHCVTSIRNLTPTAGLIRRHLKHGAASSSSVHEEIWNRMPWGPEG